MEDPCRTVLLLVGQGWHVFDDVAAVAAEYCPAAQSVHALLPVVDLYEPAAHATHVLPDSV